MVARLCLLLEEKVAAADPPRGGCRMRCHPEPREGSRPRRRGGHGNAPPILSFRLAEKKERAAPGGIAGSRCRWQRKEACNFRSGRKTRGSAQARSVFRAPQGGILCFSAAADLVVTAVFSREATIVSRKTSGNSKRGLRAPFGRLNGGESREQGRLCRSFALDKLSPGFIMSI